MGPVVLHGLQGQPLPPGRPSRQLVAPVAGMLIANEGIQLGAIARQQLIHPLLQQLLLQATGQVAEHRRQPHPAALGQGGGTFEVAAEGQGGARRGLQGQGPGGVAAGAAQQHRPPFDHLQHRVFEAAGDRTVVEQEAIGDASEAIEGFGGIAAKGLTAAVAAGGHEGATKTLSQQLVQGRSRQHHPQGSAAGGHPREGLRRARTAAQQHDRRRRVLQLEPFRRR